MERKFGRKRPVVKYPHLRARNYFMRHLAAPPASCDYTQRAKAALSRMYLNDQLGDCVPACILHAEGVFTANASGNPVMFSDENVRKVYAGASGGTFPGQDEGCDLQTALTWWENHGLGIVGGGQAPLGFLAVNAKDPIECRQCIYLFENLIFGIELPDTWYQASDRPGFFWNASSGTKSNPDFGHCVGSFGYGQNFEISSWGMEGKMTDAGVAFSASEQNGGELYSVLTMDILDRARQRAPSGLDRTQLIADFQAIGGRVRT